MTPKQIRVLVVDDHPIVRTGLRALLEYQADMQIVGEASNGLEAVECAMSLEPDVILMDITMEGNNGLQATHTIKTCLPQTKILVLTVHDNEDYVRKALEAGASGYVLKQAAEAELAVAIRAVYEGGVFLYPALTRVMFTGKPSTRAAENTQDAWNELSDRERQVLSLVALGYTNREIAATLYLSVKTVETYRARAMSKLNLQTRSALVRYALEKGLLKP